MFHRLAAKHLPYPQPLRQAIEKRDLVVAFADDGSIAYMIAPTCADVGGVRAAIELRKRWELRVAALEGALFIVTAIAIALILARLNTD